MYGVVHAVSISNYLDSIVTIVFEDGRNLELCGGFYHWFMNYFTTPGSTEYDREVLVEYFNRLVGKRVIMISECQPVQLHKCQAEGLILHCDDGPFHVWMITTNAVSKIYWFVGIDCERSEIVSREYTRELSREFGDDLFNSY